MPRGNNTKEPIFAVWLAGRPLEEIQHEITRQSKTLASSVNGGVLDWERGRQESGR